MRSPSRAIGRLPGRRRLPDAGLDLRGCTSSPGVWRRSAELVVDPGLMEMAGPRLHVDPVDGLPLLRLTHPTFTGVP